MLIISLMISSILLISVNVSVYRSQKVSSALPWCATAFFGVWAAVAYPALLQGLFTFLAILGCIIFSLQPRVLHQLSFAIFVMVYIGFGWTAWRDLEQLNAKNAPESMSDLLSYESRPFELSPPPPLPADVRLISVPRIDSEANSNREHKRFPAAEDSDTRTRALQYLHEERLNAFIDSPGFGVARMLHPVQSRIDLSDPPPIPADEAASSTPVDSLATLPLSGGDQSLSENENGVNQLHLRSLTDFLDPDRFGYPKSRQQVFGFRPHTFSKNPAKQIGSTGWRLRKLELVSLLKHAKPMVYVSKNLPRMTELRNAPTRPLDDFEAVALPRLKTDEMVLHSAPERLRVLGAIRATDQCLSCHSAKEGDLLGAFSYLLERRNPDRKD